MAANQQRCGWLLHFLPRRGLTLRQRYLGVIVTWGIPIGVWQALDAGVFRRPSRWPLFLAIELPATALGALVVALLERAIYDPQARPPTS